MVISGDTLVSDCHGAIVYIEGEDEYRCMRCMQPCKSAGSLSEKHERDNAIPKEHQRLQLAVVSAAKSWLKDAPFMSDTALAEHIEALTAFEAEHGIGEK